MNKKLEKIDYKNMSDEEQKELFLRMKREKYFEINNEIAEKQEIGENIIKGAGIVFVVIVMVILLVLYINFVAIPMK